MNQSRDAAIKALVDDLAPVERPGRVAMLTLGWLAGAWAWSLLVVTLTGPWREGALAQLTQSPQFLAESLLGLAVGATLIHCAFRTGIPSPRRVLARTWPGLALLTAWVFTYVAGLWFPALDPSMLGKREHCWFEALLYATPSLIAGLVLLRRLMPLHPRRSGALIGLAAAALPALAMQFACMYDPVHTLDHHLLPALGMAALGAVLAPRVLRGNQS